MPFCIHCGVRPPVTEARCFPNQADTTKHKFTETLLEVSSYRFFLIGCSCPITEKAYRVHQLVHQPALRYSDSAYRGNANSHDGSRVNAPSFEFFSTLNRLGDEQSGTDPVYFVPACFLFVFILVIRQFCDWRRWVPSCWSRAFGVFVSMDQYFLFVDN